MCTPFILVFGLPTYSNPSHTRAPAIILYKETLSAWKIGLGCALPETTQLIKGAVTHLIEICHSRSSPYHPRDDIVSLRSTSRRPARHCLGPNLAGVD